MSMFFGPRSGVLCRQRMGISLMEVMFAIGVLLTGLVGIAAVLPIAAKNASHALSLSRSDQMLSNQQSKIKLNLRVPDSNFFRGENSRTFFLSSTPPNRFRYPVITDAVSLPDAFCVDPWFLTAADNLRPDGATSTANNYDRTLFPCYEDNYNPEVSPALQETPSPAVDRNWSLDSSNPSRRLPRVSLSSITSSLFNERLAKDQDSISLVLNPDSVGDPPGLFLKRTQTGERSTSVLAGRFSYMITMRRTSGTAFAGTMVVFGDRQIAVDPTGAFNSRHNLATYTAAPASQNNIPINQQTYSDERLGYVTFAENIFTAGGGKFTYEMSEYVDPTVVPGDYLMLIRRDYRRTGTITEMDPAKPLNFEWYEVTSVDSKPTLATGVVRPNVNVYRTTVSVRGASWVFHPLQIYRTGAGIGPYPANPVPAGYNASLPRQYDASTVVTPGGGGNAGHTGTIGDPLYGTQVVLMKNVIGIRNFSFTF